MSVKGKVLATAATLTLLGGAGVAAAATAGAASAATPSCGAGCIDVFSHQFGTFADPQFVMDSYKQGDAAGTPVILFRTSDADPAEDFTVDQEGLVSEFYAANLVTAGVALAYGCTTGVFGACDGTGQGDYWAYEFMYSPYGVQTGLCTGVAATAVAGEKVTLQPCGVSGKTVWIAANPTQESATVYCNPATAGSGCTPDKCKVGTANCTPNPCTVGAKGCPTVSFKVDSTGTYNVTEEAGGPVVYNGETLDYSGIPTGTQPVQVYTATDVHTSGGTTTFELEGPSSTTLHTEGTYTGWTLTTVTGDNGISTLYGTSKYKGTETNPLSGDQNPLSAFAEPLINGSDTNFSSPYALTYPASSYPTDEPRPNLYVTNLLGFSTGALNTNQLWSADEGVLP
jgi:hypothetical protein